MLELDPVKDLEKLLFKIVQFILQRRVEIFSTSASLLGSQAGRSTIRSWSFYF